MKYPIIKYVVLLMAASVTLFPTVAARAAEQHIYRSGQPEVMPPPPPSPPLAAMRGDAARKEFAAAYAAQGRPAIALYWNREMTDTLAQDVSRVTDESDSSRESGTKLKNTTTDEAGASSELSENDSTGKKTRQTVELTVRSSGSSTGAKLAQKMDITLRTSFMDFLRSANARIIDRTLMMRSSTIRNDSVDSQLVEMKGLEANARFLVEVMVVPDATSLLGCGFQINIKDIRSNELLAELYTLATPPSQGPGKFTAVPGKGFERTQPSRPSVQDYGRQLGTEFLEKFASVL
ncbi:MAG: hypothetical protein Q7V04_10655 [Deltaproteobacteria bacterium]|nr:hypothetical protein [Deltaproteobacteria bacterium]